MFPIQLDGLIQKPWSKIRYTLVYGQTPGKGYQQRLTAVVHVVQIKNLYFAYFQIWIASKRQLAIWAPLLGKVY